MENKKVNSVRIKTTKGVEAVLRFREEPSPEFNEYFEEIKSLLSLYYSHNRLEDTES